MSAWFLDSEMSTCFLIVHSVLMYEGLSLYIKANLHTMLQTECIFNIVCINSIIQIYIHIKLIHFIST